MNTIKYRGFVELNLQLNRPCEHDLVGTCNMQKSMFEF
jgi:hypothetical protein